MAASGQLHTSAVSPVRKVAQYALNRRLGEPQNRSVWRVGDENDLLQVPGNELRFLGHWAWRSRTPSEEEGRRKCCRVTVGKPLDANATDSNAAFLSHRPKASGYTYCCVDLSFPWGIYCWVQILLISDSSDINSEFRPALLQRVYAILFLRL